MNVNRPSTAAPGRNAGSTTVQKIRNVLQPSMRAASISSSGMAWSAYWRIRKTPNADTSDGTMIASIRFCQPSSTMIM